MYNKGVLIHIQDKRRYDMGEKRRQEKIQDAIGLVGDDLIALKRTPVKKVLIMRGCKIAVAAILVVTLLATAIIYPHRYALVYGQYVVIAAEYPDLKKETTKEYEARKGGYESAVEGIDDFYKYSIREFLSGLDGENAIYSPVNVGVMLGMLAEITDGESRTQILNAVGVDDIETLREKSKCIWLSNYMDDDSAYILANSLWLSNDMKYKKEALEKLSQYYYASSFYGEMGSDSYTKAIRAWLNEQSKGLLEDANKDLKFDPFTAMVLASTIYFDDGWKTKFDKKNNTNGMFHTGAEDIKCTFMNETKYYDYYRGENFAAVGKDMCSDSKMWFILPDTDVIVDDILEDEEALEFIINNINVSSQRSIELSVPRFDISSEISLIDGLKNMGIRDIFYGDLADFSPAIHEDGCAVDRAEHSLRVIVDEDGVKAAGQTVVGLDWDVPDNIKFVLDRPFIFVISSDVGAPLFVGVVNQPQ